MNVCTCVAGAHSVVATPYVEQPPNPMLYLLPSHRMETSSTVIEARRGSSISSSNLESVTEEREEAGEYIGEDEEEEDLLAYGDDVYPNMIFKSNPFLVEKPREVRSNMLMDILPTLKMK